MSPDHAVRTSLFLSYEMPRRPLSHSYELPGEKLRRVFRPARDRNSAHDRSSITMIAMPLTYPGSSRPQPARRQALPKSFQPLDPGIIDASIPTFFVGRDPDGFWFARGARGENGGLFLFKSSALAFARRASSPSPLGCATILLSQRFELDVENQGNPLIGYLRPLLRRLAGWEAGPIRLH